MKPNWNQIIGQERAKGALEKKLVEIQKDGIFPRCAFYDAPGLGKSVLASAWAGKVSEEIGCMTHHYNAKGTINKTDTTFSDTVEFIQNVLNNNTPETRGILILDEIASKEALGSGNDELRSYLSKFVDGKQFTLYRGEEVTYSNKRLGVILCSYSTAKLPGDTKTRYTQTAEMILELYTPEELAVILKGDIARDAAKNGRQAPATSPKGLMRIARSMRGNARQSELDIVPTIYTEFANTGKGVTVETALTIMKNAGVYPHGLSMEEIRVIRYLQRKRVASAGEITANCSIKSEEWRKAKNYLEIGTGKTANPFQMTDKEGEEIEGFHGPLIDSTGTKFHLTEHGKRIFAVLNGW